MFLVIIHTKVSLFDLEEQEIELILEHVPLGLELELELELKLEMELELELELELEIDLELNLVLFELSSAQTFDCFVALFGLLKKEKIIVLSSFVFLLILSQFSQFS
mgnify:CR=1 FL=1